MTGLPGPECLCLVAVQGADAPSAQDRLERGRHGPVAGARGLGGQDLQVTKLPPERFGCLQRFEQLSDGPDCGFGFQNRDSAEERAWNLPEDRASVYFAPAE